MTSLVTKKTLERRIGLHKVVISELTGSLDSGVNQQPLHFKCNI